MKKIQKNDNIELEIVGLTVDGNGVGKYDGMAVFVTGCAIGDVIEVHIIKVSKNYAIGKINKIIIPSEDRIEADCDVNSQCGGCVFRHISYEGELNAKWSRVNDAIKRIGHLDVTPEKIIGADNIYNYRNKAQYPVCIENGDVKIGFYAFHSHRIVNCTNCSLQPVEFEKGLDAFKKWIKENNITSFSAETGKGILRHIYFRKAFGTGEIMACAVINGNDIPNKDSLIKKLITAIPKIKSIVLNINKEKNNVILGKKSITIWGNDTITDELLSMKFTISPNSFYQVNHSQTKKLYTIAKEYADLNGNEILVDMYCGAGTIGLTMADKCKKLIGIEIVPQAVENAKINAELNNVENAQFMCADATDGAKELEKNNIRADVVVIDPPRKGCDNELINIVVNMAPDRIVYVSCDPATLARDLAIFDKKGYKTVMITPVDLFPRTAHVETVVKLSKGEINSKKVRVDFSLEDMDMSQFQNGATYEQIKARVLGQTGLKVSSLYISQIKRKCGLDVGKNYNLSKKEDAKVPQCPLEKETAIMDAMKYYGII